jgi:hypothetical protein
MSTRGLLFQRASTIKIQLSVHNFGALVLHTEDSVWFPYKGGEDPEVR